MKKTNKKGFTLIETVVSMVIAGIILSVIYYSFSMSLRISRSGNNILTATNIAKTIYLNFLNEKKDTLLFFDDYKENGDFGEGWEYSINIKGVSININDKFDMNIEKHYKFMLALQKDKKEYNFDFYFEK